MKLKLIFLIDVNVIAYGLCSRILNDFHPFYFPFRTKRACSLS